jgi:hypothetical protein
MTSDSGLISQDSDYPKAIQEVLDELCQMQQTPRLVTSPEELETLEREIRQCTDRLGSLWSGTICNRPWIRRPCKPSKSGW